MRAKSIDKIGWKVYVEEDSITIGCQWYDKTDIKKIAKALEKAKTSGRMIPVSNGEAILFVGPKYSIPYLDGGKLTLKMAKSWGYFSIGEVIKDNHRILNTSISKLIKQYEKLRVPSVAKR